MAATSITVRTDDGIKRQAAEILADLGMDMSTGVNVFLRALVREGGIPFAVTVEPSAAYREWMKRELAISWELSKDSGTQRISHDAFWKEFL